MKLEAAVAAARQAVLALTFVSAAGGAVEASGPPPDPAVFVYDCDNLATITGRQFADRLEIWGGAIGRLVLPQVGNDPATFADRTATVTMNADYLRMTGSIGDTVCRRNAAEAPWQDARLRGIEFRATGTRPDWTLEYDEGASLTLVARGDFAPLTARAPFALVATGGDHMTIEGSDGARAVLVAIDRGVCAGPSGVTTARVTVTVDDRSSGTLRSFSGCGRTLLSGKLEGTFTWDDRLPPDAVLTLRIIRAGAAASAPPIAEWRGPAASSPDSPFVLEYDAFGLYGEDRFVLESSIHAGPRSCRSRGPLYVLTWGTFGRITLSYDVFAAPPAASAPARRAAPPGCRL